MALAPSITITLPGYPFENFPSLPTVTALRALPSVGLSTGDNYVVDGAAAEGDGGGGVFSWNDASLASDDGITVVRPDDTSSGQAGRWILASASAIQSLVDAALDADLPTKANTDLDNLTAGITSIDPNFEGSGVPAIRHDVMDFVQNNVSATDVANITIIRRADYAGGSPGFTNNALRVLSYVGEDTDTFEWAATFICDNSASAGENVGSYSIGLKRGTGPTWGALSEVKEMSPVNNPTTGTVAHEFDVSVNGTDNVFPYARVGSDLAIRRHDASGADAEVGWGYRIQNGGYANSLVRIGFGFYTGMRVVDAFDCSRGTVLGAALKMAAGVPISFDAGDQHLVSYEGGGVAYKAAGTLQFRQNANGSFQSRALTFATLPAAGSAGNRAFITDCNTTTFNAVAAGGGANKVPVFDDGAAWRVG